MNNTEIFLLTKPPQNDRTRLCFSLWEHSQNAVMYLAGDGVYNLPDAAGLQVLLGQRVMACREDLVARGVVAGEWVTVPDNFYELLVEDIMSEGSRIYTF